MKKLVYKNGKAVEVGQTATTFRGEVVTVEAIVPPKHDGSTGRVLVKMAGMKREFYPSVIDAEWRDA